MPHCKSLQVLWLVGACLPTWAAPLGSLAEQKSCETRNNAENPEHHDHETVCVSSLLQSPHQQHRQPGYKEAVGVTDYVIGPNRLEEFVQRSIKSQYHEDTTLSVNKKNSQSLSATRSPFFSKSPFITPEKSYKAKGPAGLLAPVTLRKKRSALQNVSPSLLPFWQNTNRPAHTEATLGDYISLHYSDVEHQGSVQPPFTEEGRGRDIKNDSAEEISKSINLAASAPPTSKIYDEQTGSSPVEKAGITVENPFTATGLHAKALVPGLMQPDLNLNYRITEAAATWTEAAHLQGEEVSILHLAPEVSTEATMSSEHLPLIFEPFDSTPSTSLALASELSVSMVPKPEMLEEAESVQAVSLETFHAHYDASFPGPFDWPPPWQMSGAENLDTVIPSRMPTNSPTSEADLENNEGTQKLQSGRPASMEEVHVSASPATTQIVSERKSSHLNVLKPTAELQELDTEENEDEDDEDLDESDEEEDGSEEELTEAPEHSPSHPPYSLIPPPPVWGHRNQGLFQSCIELIGEKAGYISGMLAPVGIGIAGALVIVGALYGIRLIHRKRKHSLKQQRRKQPTEVRHGPDHAMLLADSSEDEF